MDPTAVNDVQGAPLVCACAIAFPLAVSGHSEALTRETILVCFIDDEKRRCESCLSELFFEGT